MTESGIPVPVKSPASAKGKLRLDILVVDDSSAVRQFMRAKLDSLAGDFEVRVTVASSGSEALILVEENHFDLVFLDVVMPGLDGHEVCRRIKQIRPTRVAMLSSLKSPEDHKAGHVAGCDNYLTKPPQDADLQAVLRIVSLRKAVAL